MTERPSDVTGVTIYDQKSGVFEFYRGPVFASIVLADEINRASPKTQAALLEVMEENRVTVDGKSYDVGQPFMVVATQNPIEQAGTYRLPEAQLDRFLMIDTGHLVAWDATLTYTVGKSGSGWIASFFSGEGLACHFQGQGRIWIQTRNASEYGRAVGKLLPPREA